MSTTSAGAAPCPTCLLRHCLCAEVPRVETVTEFVIVRHPRERTRSSNTGRLAAQAMPRARILDRGGPAPWLQPHEVPAGAWLLFPDGPPRDGPPADPPATVIVLDGTWDQARHMRQRWPALRGLPILHPPGEPATARRLRAAPAPGMVSTIEAIARAVRLLEGDAPARQLEQLFDLACARAAASGRPLPA
jgi:DTW domain-containing protein YfiP